MRSVSRIQPSPIPDATAHLLHLALHDVVRTSAVSMAELRECVNACAAFLRDSDLGPAQMILAMKDCARGGNRLPRIHDEDELANVDFLMDQIIKWAIIEYYKEA